MDITVTIPNGKVDNVLAALAADPSFPDPPEGADAAALKAYLTTYYGDKWKDEVRALLRQHRRQQSIQAAVAADQALPDPLA